MSSKSVEERLFVGVFPTGLGYADRTVEVSGDYKSLAFLPFRSLTLEWRAKRLDAPMRVAIEKHAAGIIARRGERYEVSKAGQYVVLGEE